MHRLTGFTVAAALAGVLGLGAVSAATPPAASFFHVVSAEFSWSEEGPFPEIGDCRDSMKFWQAQPTGAMGDGALEVSLCYVKTGERVFEPSESRHPGGGDLRVAP